MRVRRRVRARSATARSSCPTHTHRDARTGHCGRGAVSPSRKRSAGRPCDATEKGGGHDDFSPRVILTSCLCSRNFSPPKLLSDDRAPTIRPHTCWVTAANLLPRHAPTDDYSSPQIAEDTCTALGHHMLDGRMNLCSSACEESAHEHNGNNARLPHGDERAVCCLPDTRPSSPASYVLRLTVTFACWGNHIITVRQCVGAHSAEALGCV